MKRTGTILLAVVIGTLQWAGTMMAQNAVQKGDLEAKNKELQVQVDNLQKTIAALKAKLAETEAKAKESMVRAAKMAAEAAKQKQQMMAVFQQMMVRRGGGLVGMVPGGIQKQLVPAPQKQPVKIVTGNITKIDPKDNSLVQLNIGSKNELKLGQTLSVVRRNPQPVYLGEIRIVELTPDSALGRHVVLPGRRIRPLQTGDIVTNEPKSVKTESAKVK